jgi:hypothetical protein
MVLESPYLDIRALILAPAPNARALRTLRRATPASCTGNAPVARCPDAKLTLQPDRSGGAGH